MPGRSSAAERATSDLVPVVKTVGAGEHEPEHEAGDKDQADTEIAGLEFAHEGLDECEGDERGRRRQRGQVRAAALVPACRAGAPSRTDFSPRGRSPSVAAVRIARATSSASRLSPVSSHIRAAST